MGSIHQFGFAALVASVISACGVPVPGGSKPAPSTTAVTSWDELRTRPLNLPTVGQGQPCPVSPSTRPPEGGGLLRGAGPVYNNPNSVPAGIPTKVPFFASSSYTGPVLVRGKQLDGPNRLLFGLPKPEAGWQALAPAYVFKYPNGVEEPLFAEMDLMKTSNTIGGLPAGWRFWPTMTYAPTQGCYAWQVDGASFSQVIVFEASS